MIDRDQNQAERNLVEHQLGMAPFLVFAV
jgi:hypothetical protein